MSEQSLRMYFTSKQLVAIPLAALGAGALPVFFRKSFQRLVKFTSGVRQAAHYDDLLWKAVITSIPILYMCQFN
jgi:hypothetical protein